MRIFITVEIPHGESGVGDRKVHEIEVPEFHESGRAPQTVGSLTRFSSGKRRYASKEDAACYQDRCSWGPKALFTSIQPEAVWLEENRPHAERMKAAGVEWPDITNPKEFPRIRHKSLWDFYKAIGFDHETRCYRDEAGEPIKYSLRPAKKIKQQELAIS